MQAVPGRNSINHKFERLERYFPHTDRPREGDCPDTGQSTGQGVNGFGSGRLELAHHRPAQKPVLERIIQQDVGRDEVALVDGGSKDGTPGGQQQYKLD